MRFAMEINTQSDRRFSQRDLADKLKVAPTMVTRYLQGRVEFWSMKAVTLDLLAKSCGLDVGTLYVWMEQGRDAALLHEERMAAQPTMTKPEDLLRRALSLLENEKKPPGQKRCRYPALIKAIEDLKDSVGELMFERLVRLSGAEEVLQRLAQGEELWLDAEDTLAKLLDVGVEEVRQLAGGALEADRQSA